MNKNYEFVLALPYTFSLKTDKAQLGLVQQFTALVSAF